jgi:Zn-dependent alcohol dehydrogenase
MVKKIIILLAFAAIFTSCAKECPECTQQKKNYCEQLKLSNCNGVGLTQYIDEMIRLCGQDDANNYVHQALLDCQSGKLICPECTK